MVLCHCVGRSITTAVLQPRLTTISLSVASLHVWHARIVKGLVVCSFRDAQFFLFSSLNDTGPCCSDLCGPPRLDRPCGIDGEPTEQLRLLVGRGIIFLTFGAQMRSEKTVFCICHVPSTTQLFDLTPRPCPRDMSAATHLVLRRNLSVWATASNLLTVLNASFDAAGTAFCCYPCPEPKSGKLG